jgi:hypothetical protein
VAADPTGTPFQAPCVEGLLRRRAAIRWLLAF